MQEIIAKTRTFRRFVEKDTISTATLYELIDLARLGGSARNGQPWQYMLVNSPEICVEDLSLSWLGRLSFRLERPCRGRASLCLYPLFVK